MEDFTYIYMYVSILLLFCTWTTLSICYSSSSLIVSVNITFFPSFSKLISLQSPVDEAQPWLY